MDWWGDRKATEQAWRVDATRLIQRDDDGRVVSCNLDLKNPHEGGVEDHRTPNEIIDAIIDKERHVIEIMAEIKTTLAEAV